MYGVFVFGAQFATSVTVPPFVEDRFLTYTLPVAALLEFLICTVALVIDVGLEKSLALLNCAVL